MATREEIYSPPETPTREAVVNRALTRAYTLNWEAIAYAAILILALVTRLADLGTRVMSHDESLHTYYSWRLYEFGEFQHTPLMHGPLLFHMTALSYFLFGDDDFTARLYPALLGVLIVMFPALFRRWLGRFGALAASVLLLISPQLLYYSRYIRHDIPTIFFALLMVYGIVQYIDGRPIRRPGWIPVIGVGLIGMLASKEVAFIYIALFGSFLTLYWLARVTQDVGIRRADPADDAAWQPPRVQLLIGHVLLVALAGLLALTLGALARQLIAPARWFPSALPMQVALFAVIWVPLAASGLIRRALGRQGGAASAIMQGLARGRSAMMVLVAGAILGALLALLIIVVMDVIKPDTIWPQTTVLSANDQATGINGTKEYAQATGFEAGMFVRLLTWIGLPALLVLFVVFLSAVFNFPGTLPIPWRELLLMLLIAVVVASVLVMFERRSFVSETTAQPFAADPTESAEHVDGNYDNTPIWVAWGVGLVVVLLVVGTRLLTGLWDFLNRQPIFDVLIVIGTLILPWLTAFPLYWAGYNLENYNAQVQEGADTVRAAFIALVPFLAVSIAVGMAWNWRRWLPVAALFTAIFAFFFTTVFSNQNGLITGAIGSLGYWLEQQEVRRGSQPQYYYVLTQLPVYEYVALIGALGAGVSGLGIFWRFRRDRRLEAQQAAWAAEDAALAAEGNGNPLPDELDPAATLVSEIERTQALPVDPDEESHEPPSVIRYTGAPGRLVRPYDPAEEARHRHDEPEWIGALPFLGMVGYWAILILVALTIAGEKMPWLTTHLTIPLILLAGWWFGRVASGLRPAAIREVNGWTLLIAIPIGLVALAHVVVQLWGENTPFSGRTPEQLTASGTWLAAALIVLGALYIVGRVGRRVGGGQLIRLAGVTAVTLLAILTARTAVLAAYINHDYATEYLVYAHAGPAIKTVLNEIDRLAALTNEDDNMRIVFDDESSWPYTWYFRHYANYGYLRGEAGSVDPATLDGARVVVVGGKKAGDVRRILGDAYYETNYIRLWWPMQEYFNLTYDRVAKVFRSADDNLASKYYREGLFDIWWERDYSTYAQAMCIDSRQARCKAEAQLGETPEDQARNRHACAAAVVAECRGDERFAVNNWPVSDRMYVFVDKSIAAQVWDAGIGSSSVNIREPEYPEDQVFRPLPALDAWGADLGLAGPRGLAIDAEGRAIVADTENNRLLALEDGAIAQTIAPEDDPFRQPWGVAVAPGGEIIVADTWNHRVRVFSAAGELLRQWGHEGIVAQDASPDAFWGPRDVAVGLDGSVYVADTGNKRVRVYTFEGELIRDLGGAGSGLGQLDEPVGLAIHPVTGELYVADTWNQRIAVFDADGLPLHTWDVHMWHTNRQSYNRPYLAIDPSGTLLYVTDMDDKHRIVAYWLDGTPALSFNLPRDLGAGALEVRSPAGMAFDAEGRLYVVDAEQGQARIVIFSASDVGASAFEALSPGDEGAGEAQEPIIIPQDESGDAIGAKPQEPSGATGPTVQEINGVPVVRVPEGCFPMHKRDGTTEICLSAFWLGQTEVTHAQYAACVEAGECPAPSDRTYYDDPAYAAAPVVHVPWDAAQAYAAWAGGSLPTEAQWEYAARGAVGSLYPWGENEPGCDVANMLECGGLQPVGAEIRSAGASWVGAVDLAGSVWEWTAGWADDAYYASLEDGALDPLGPETGTLRVVRGGSWGDPAPLMAATSRARRNPQDGYATVGFRVALADDPAPDGPTVDATEDAAG